MNELVLSFSQAQTMATCGRQYRYRYVDRLEPLETSVALPVGTAVHEAVTAYVHHHALYESFDILSKFEESWTRWTSGRRLKFPAFWDIDSLHASARRLVELFPAAWEQSNLVAVIDADGVPIVERELIVPVSHDVKVKARIDILARDLVTGKIGLTDVKSTSAVHDEAFGLNSMQLTTYQHAVEYVYGDQLRDQQGDAGPVIEHVGFLELVKRKLSAKGQGPTVEPPKWYPRRSERDVQEMLTAYRNIASDVRAQRFDRPFASSFNSPCNTCDFARLCVHNDASGYRPRTTP
jgi:hypothetical protein